MSGIGELAYMVLLGWMRGLVDWFWRVVSGGSGGGLQWFLSEWKLWLVILLAGGLIIDWMMWLVRWRPYRVFLRRFRKEGGEPLPAEAWDTGAGYYEPETVQDTEPADWSDLTLSTLSEIDPNWAEGVFVDVEDEQGDEAAAEAPAAGQYAKTYFYTDAYEEPGQAFAHGENASGYWESEPADEAYESQWQALPYEEEPEHREKHSATRADDRMERPEAADEAEYYDDDDDDDNDDDARDQAAGWVELPNEPPSDAQAPEEALYGRTAMWPTSFSHAPNPATDSRQTPEPGGLRNDYHADEPFEEDIQKDPLFAKDHGPETPHRESRMLRRLRKSDRDISHRRSRQSLKEERQVSAFQKTRPQRLVQSVSATPGSESGGFRTVTGKPVRRQGLLGLASTDDEPIPGLPPMQVDNAFYPKAMPRTPDFSDDDGNY